MPGIAGVRFTAEDGVHFGFVELELLLEDWYVFRAEWRAIRWGYNIQPDAPLTIPP